MYGDILQRLRDLARFEAEVYPAYRASRFNLIHEAEAAGHSRKEIADALGISRQALARFIERRTQ